MSEAADEADARANGQADEPARERSITPAKVPAMERPVAGRAGAEIGAMGGVAPRSRVPARAADLPGIDVSVVIPVYNEADNLRELVERVGQALAPTGRVYELLLIDDGSSDDSRRILGALAESHRWLRPLILIRNYGQSTALQAGFDHAQGALIVTLDGDLQNDPVEIPRLLEFMDQQPEVDVVSGWRKQRQDRTWSRKLPSWVANRLISAVTGVRLHDYGCALKVYRRAVLDNLRLYGETHRFIAALAVEAGARMIEVPVLHHARVRGQSKYGIDRVFRVLLDLLWIKFSMRFLHRPLHAFGGVGFAFIGLGAAALFYLAVEKLVFGHDIGGRPLLLLGALLTLIGVQLLATGVLSELLTRIYHEPQGRRQYVLRRDQRAE
jgi:glycosyltransferase involved in cell wall biosynthesis